MKKAKEQNGKHNKRLIGKQNWQKKKTEIIVNNSFLSYY